MRKIDYENYICPICGRLWVPCPLPNVDYYCEHCYEKGRKIVHDAMKPKSRKLGGTEQ